MLLPPPRSTLFPYTTLFRSASQLIEGRATRVARGDVRLERRPLRARELAVEIRSEEHTSELQSRGHLVCRLLLEKKKYHNYTIECPNLAGVSIYRACVYRGK